ncbi:MAG: carbamoyltransferase HypF [Desulfomonile tiedjei]|uniref:Carbamoyltransferase n=1 Tax=Desulfomonile tiedjei TaxID=2358 RepID=A0A9D6Z928_9BACT|nr:carbamoyltransferase HypF [Desulfomonile tiedjei]
MNETQSGIPNKTVRKHIVLTGVLQGIGCRPTVYRVASRLRLAGWVVNTTQGVRIEIEGSPEQCDRFVKELPAAIPFPGLIESAVVQDVTPLGESGFRIEASIQGERTVTPIPPDVATCKECVDELFDAKNPRFLYPFTTCTLCGPRFTVVRAFPYDRERTSMADFKMCERCAAEYSTPEDRRFHSQTNSCPECGPRLWLANNQGHAVEGDPILKAVEMLMAGKILGVKGIGGFHLACDALNENAVNTLRDRKGRAEKPFAVMAADIDTVRRYCTVTEIEEHLLTSAVSPIVLMENRGTSPAPNVAPFVGTLGVMLPYSPLHYLLFNHPEIPREKRPELLVMTSGNRSEEPIVRDNEEALDRIKDLVDGFLFHNREIVLRTDDSIFRVIADNVTVFRRSRGLVPGEFRIHPTLLVLRSDSGEKAENCNAEPVILGSGGDLKNAAAVIKRDQLVPGPHVGDLASPVGQDYFKQSLQVLTDYLEAAPSLVAVDPHPEYFSSSLACELGIRVEEVFHHHAHAVSLLFQHAFPGPAVFAVFDGTGYGTDGTIWGGEFLVADVKDFTRAGHIKPFSLPGGEAAIREPIRILAALLAENGELPEEFIPLMGEHAGRVKLWLEAVKKNINSPLASSAGRLFDAAAAAAGFRRQVTFEGQAAMWLEAIADKSETGEYKLELHRGNELIADSSALIMATARDMLDGAASERVAARFHNTVARLIAEALLELSRRTGIETVGLTGGCFQNKLLTERAVGLLTAEKLKVLLHSFIPPNDGGIAVGQAVSALARSQSGHFRNTLR